MKQTVDRLALSFMGLSMIAAVSLSANPVTVEELGVGPNETVYINSTGPYGLGTNLHVYASVVDLKVNGVSTTGFCIDPWHWSLSGPLSYNTESLAVAPKPPGPMGTTAANKIEQLWAHYYSSGPVSNITAAALQLEIWQLVDFGVSGGTTFHLDSIDHDSAAVLSLMADMSHFLDTNPDAPKANLIAVTGSGQDYVIQSIPDGGTTVALFGLGLACLVGFRRKLVR